MGIQFECQCGKHYRVSNKYAGQSAQCRHCGAALHIPAAQAVAAPHAAEPPLPQAPPQPQAPPLPGETSLPAFNFAIDTHAPAARNAPPVPPPPPAPPASSPTPAATAPPAAPVLISTGNKPALPSRTIFSEIKKLPDTQLISSQCYRLAGQPRFQVYAGFGSQLTNTNPGEHNLSRLEVFHLRDRLGDYAVLQPYDGSGPLPVEYVGRMRGCLPTPLALLKTSADRQLEVGSALAGPLGVLLAQAAAKVQSVWAATDGSQPPLALAAQHNAALSENIHWDGEFKMGPLSVTHHLRWAAQAVPLDDECYLLVAASVPRKKLIGLRFDLPWFARYRTEFANLVNAQQATECGEFDYVDPGVWLLGTTEALHWVDLD